MLYKLILKFINALFIQVHLRVKYLSVHSLHEPCIDAVKDSNIKHNKN